MAEANDGVGRIDERLGSVETHGAKLDQLAQDLKPLGEMRDFFRLVADDHERRISALEERGG